MNPIIEAALARLYANDVALMDWNDSSEINNSPELLAALIRAAAEPQDTDSLGLEHSAGWCVICGGPVSSHRADCALIALCKAITGEQP